MTLQQLLYFRRAAECGSFNAAARGLHCTQPAVSEQVRRLEVELGVSLFARAGNGLTLTSEGRVFLAHALQVTEAAEEALASVGRRRAEREWVLSVGTFRNAPYYDIAALVEVYRSQHPDARVQMRGQNSFDVARAVYGQEVEIGLVVLPIDDALLEVHPLFRDEVVLVSPAAAARDEAVRIEELAELPLVLYDATYGFDDPTRRQLAARAQEAGILLEPIVEVEHVETALQLVARGMGSTVAASSVVRASADPQAVSSVGFSEPFYDSFAVVTRRGVRLSPAAQALMDLISPWAAGVSSRLV